MRIRIIDAFTDRPFAGNPAGVCLLDGDAWPDEVWLQQVAAEMNLPETAFARRLAPEEGADWGLRWFTPLVEMDLCGHATLATAHALRGDDPRLGTVRFRSRSGILLAHAQDDGTITLDFPAATVREVPAPEGLTAALRHRPESTHDTGTFGALLAVLPDEATVRAIEPDLAVLAGLSKVGVIVTAAGTGPGYDFVSRFFAPAVGIPEDPVTGGAHTALGPYWSARLGRDELTGRQVSARSGTVRTRVRGDRVELAGKAVTVVDGELRAVPPPPGSTGR